MANTMGVESFLGLSTSAQFILKHGGTTGTGFAIGANGRNGGNSLRQNTSTNWSVVYDSAASGFAGGAHRANSALIANELFSVADATVTHITVNLLSNGALEIRRGTTTGTLLATSATGIIVNGVYTYLEFSWTINDSTGAFEVKANGVSAVSVTATDTRNAGTAAVTKIFFWHPETASDWTDIYYNQSGYWGDGRVEMLKPSGNGNSSILVGSDGNSTDNYLLVDEQTPNDDTDYVTSATPGDKDTYAMDNLVSTGGTVQCVQLVDYFRKDDAGARSIVTVARLSGTEADSAVFTAATTYGYARDPRTTKPGGGSWSISDVNSSEVGTKVNA